MVAGRMSDDEPVTAAGRVWLSNPGKREAKALPEIVDLVALEVDGMS